VTLKTRLGWDEDRSAPDLARRAEAAGVRLVTIHGRTRCQFYAGRADWAAIRAVREAVTVPLVANGDIGSAADARAALALSGADGVHDRARRAGKALAARAGGGGTGRRPVPAAPAGEALADLVCAHHEEMLAFYGRALGGRVARKHLGWYLDAAGAPSAARATVVTCDDPARVAALVRAALAHAPALAA
jgi:tRNA-dihydrouridine synthase